MQPAKKPPRPLPAAVRAFLWLPSEIHYIFAYVLPPLVLAWLHRGGIRCVKGPARPKPGKSVVAVVPFFGNDAVLPSFLGYYRGLGVAQFVFLDLSRGRALAQTLSDDADCVVWLPRAKFVVSPALHWLNFLRKRYSLNRWCLSVDPCDFMVFPFCETRRLPDLTEFLESEGRRHIYALVLEAYGGDAAERLRETPGASPRELLPYFDPVGYSYVAKGPLRTAIVSGGIQRRMLFADTPPLSPALNRTPLVRWRWFYSYAAATRMMVPGILNTPHSTWHLNPTACLMRYALLDDEAAAAIAEKVERTVAIRDKVTPSYPGLAKLRGRTLKQPSSARFVDSQDLIAWGLMNLGQWF